jgi:hypothetical protein
MSRRERRPQQIVTNSLLGGQVATYDAELPEAGAELRGGVRGGRGTQAGVPVRRGAAESAQASYKARRRRR